MSSAQLFSSNKYYSLNAVLCNRRCGWDYVVAADVCWHQ